MDNCFCTDDALCNYHLRLIRGEFSEPEKKLKVVRGPIEYVNRKIAECGTRAGYNRHRRLGEQTCSACRLAQNEATLKWQKENPISTSITHKKSLAKMAERRSA